MAKTSITAKLGLDTTAFQRGMAKSQQTVKNFAKGATASFIRMGAAFAGIGLVRGIAKLGLAAGETASKFRAVFGPATDEMTEKVKELRKTIPSTTAEMQNALSTFAAMAKGFGLNTNAANLFSVQMVKVAGDIASFHDLPIEEAFGKIRSAVSGEFEPLKQLGIVINEARLKQEALNLKIWEGTGTMSAAQKSLAVTSIMIRDMGDANGDAALTAGSAANRVKFLRAELLETGTKIGTTALPAILALTDGLSQFLELTKDLTDFMGTKVGEMMYGPTDESIKKINLAVQLRKAEKQAVKELTEEGELYKQGIFEGTLWTKGLSEKLEGNKVKIKERTALIMDGLAAEKTAAKAKTAADDKSIKNASDLSAELEKQIKTEKDPARKKALEDRLDAYKELLKAAGKLESLQSKKPTGASKTADTKVAAKNNGDPRSTFRSKFGPKQSFRDRERAGGLYNSTLGRDGAKLDEMVDNGGTAKADNVELQKRATEYLEEIATEIKKNPS